jgi:hypothetical protein
VKEHYRSHPTEDHPQEYALEAPLYLANLNIGIQLRAPGGIVVGSFLEQ